MKRHERYADYELVRVAGRWNNPKRNYLLVNPLQAKHIPVSPLDALSMMRELGAAVKAAEPGCRLVIGFAETATAIGAAVASVLGDGCAYYHTTREDIGPADGYAAFEEEHSHAVAQKLSLRGLEDALSRTESVVFVDDELTTGRTLRNIVSVLSEAVPALRSKRLLAACAISRLSEEDLEAMRAARFGGIVSLLDGIGFDPSLAARDYEVSSPDVPAEGRRTVVNAVGVPGMRDPRTGTDIAGYCSDCAVAAVRVLEQAAARLAPGGSVRVLGTEECMYPALVAGAMLEAAGYRAVCHATTRSPIGVCAREDYPIRSSVSLPSVYDAGRKTYLYDLDDKADLCVAVTDASFDGELLGGLAAAVPETAFVPVVLMRASGGKGAR